MAGGCGHTAAEHESFKTPGIFETLDFIGHQPGDPERGWSDYEMRNVPGTECTIVRPCVLTEAQRATAREENHQKSLRFKAQVDQAREAAWRRRVS
jgi:hypothetical protein